MAYKFMIGAKPFGFIRLDLTSTKCEGNIVQFNVLSAWAYRRKTVGRHLNHNFIQRCPSTLVYDVMVRHYNTGNGPFARLVTWYKINHAGTYVGQWDFKNAATRASSNAHFLVLEVRLCNLQSSMVDFVPCDWVMERAYSDVLLGKALGGLSARKWLTLRTTLGRPR